MNENTAKVIMGASIVKVAMTLQETHEMTHTIAEVAVSLVDVNTATDMVELCEHFHAIDDILKRSAMRLDAELAKLEEAEGQKPMFVSPDRSGQSH